MYERELQNKILASLYKQYRINGCVKLVISELSKNIPEVTLERVFEMCKKLNEQKYIRCTFLTGNDGLINEITVDGRSYVEESLLPQKDTPKNDSNQLIIMDTAPKFRPEDKIYQFFISSTYEDLKEERQAVMAAVISTGNVPVGMEYFPAGDQSQFDYIKKLIDKVDYYILISAGKYGSICDETGLSYTEMEYDYAVSKKIPIAVFPVQSLDRLTGDKIDRESPKPELLDKFRKKIMADRMAALWDNKYDLKAKVISSIHNLIYQSPRPGWVRADNIIEEKNEADDFDYNTLVELHPTWSEEDLIFRINKEDLEKYPKSLSWKQIIINLGDSLCGMVPDFTLREMLETRLLVKELKDRNEIIKEMLRMNLIIRKVVNNDYEGCYVNMTFSKKGQDVWLSLKE